MIEQVDEKVEFWAIVEVMGHVTYAGRVSQYTAFGAALVRVEVPEIVLSDGSMVPAFEKLLGVGSIYAITPCTEAAAREAARQFRKRPLTMVALPIGLGGRSSSWRAKTSIDMPHHDPIPDEQAGRVYEICHGGQVLEVVDPRDCPGPNFPYSVEEYIERRRLELAVAHGCDMNEFTVRKRAFRVRMVRGGERIHGPTIGDRTTTDSTDGHG